MTATPPDGPTFSALLDVDTLAMILGVVDRYCARHDIDRDTRREVVRLIFNHRVETEAVYDDEGDGALVGHLVEAPQQELLRMAREVMRDYLEIIEIDPDGRPFRLI